MENSFLRFPPSGQTAAATRPPSGPEVADWIRERIRRGRFVPGQRLVEVDIIRQTGASRSKVREAFRRLEGEGLVQIEEFRGASVRAASIEEVRQIYRARTALEGICAADFTRRATPEHRARLLELQRKLDECVEKNAPEQFGRLNVEWHLLLIEGAGNPVIGELIQRLNVPIHRLLFESFYNADRLRVANADHRIIIDAIMADNAAGAEAAMRKHVGDGFSTLERLNRAIFA